MGIYHPTKWTIFHSLYYHYCSFCPAGQSVDTIESQGDETDSKWHQLNKTILIQNSYIYHQPNNYWSYDSTNIANYLIKSSWIHCLTLVVKSNADFGYQKKGHFRHFRHWDTALAMRWCVQFPASLWRSLLSKLRGSELHKISIAYIGTYDYICIYIHVDMHILHKIIYIYILHTYIAIYK